jgi:acyl-coenzyme A thioesterase PaaI-like protein
MDRNAAFRWAERGVTASPNASIGSRMQQSPTQHSTPSFVLSEDAEPGIPEGFRRLLGGGAYMQLLGPVYMRKREDGRNAVIGLHIAPGHLNMQGIPHGGMLATVADSALGINVALARGIRAAQVTLSLTNDFLSSAALGDWLEARVQVHHLDEKLAHASCELWAGERVVMRASAVFSLRQRAFGVAPGGTSSAAGA